MNNCELIFTSNEYGKTIEKHLKVLTGKKKSQLRSTHSGAAEMNPTRNPEVVGSIPGLTQSVKDLASL